MAGMAPFLGSIQKGQAPCLYRALKGDRFVEAHSKLMLYSLL